MAMIPNVGRFRKDMSVKVLPVLSGFATLLVALPASANIVLDGGYKVEGEFNEFVPTGKQLITREVIPGLFFTERPYLLINVYFTNTFTFDDAVRLEFFADQLQETPLFSCEFTGGNDTTVPGTNYGITWSDCPDAFWPDFQGAYRFTMLSGTSDLNYFNITTYVNQREYILNVDSFPPPIPAPEPSSLALLSLGVGSLFLRQRNPRRPVSNPIASVRPPSLCGSVVKTN